MSRYGGSAHAINADIFDTDATPDRPQAAEVMEAWRDLWRTWISGAANMRVSDIWTWPASSVYTGYAFEIHDSTLNRSIYIWTGGGHTSVGDSDDIVGGGSTTAHRGDVLSMNDAAGTSAVSVNGVGMIMNPDTSISRAGVPYDSLAEMTFTGGDFTDVSGSFNPDSSGGLSAMRPSHATPGGLFEEVFSTVTTSFSKFAMAYDDEEGVFFAESTLGNDAGVRYELLMGGWIKPGSGDTNREGTLRIQATTSQNATYTHNHAVVSAFDAGGTLRTYDLSPAETLVGANAVVQSGPDAGLNDWLEVAINNGSGGSGTKGTSDSRYCVEIGAYDDGRFDSALFNRPDAANPVCRRTESLAFMWVQGEIPPNVINPVLT